MLCSYFCYTQWICTWVCVVCLAALLWQSSCLAHCFHLLGYFTLGISLIALRARLLFFAVPLQEQFKLPPNILCASLIRYSSFRVFTKNKPHQSISGYCKCVEILLYAISYYIQIYLPFFIYLFFCFSKGGYISK